MAEDEQKGSEEKEAAAIPVLRTFQSDVDQVGVESKDGIRGILAKEMEEKKKAQEEYRKNVKELAKESLKLQDRKRRFLSKKEGSEEAAAEDIEKEHIDGVVSGAVAHMETQQEGGESVSESTEDLVEQSPEEVVEEPSGDSVPKVTVQRGNFGAGIVEGEPIVSPSHESEDNQTVAAEVQQESGESAESPAEQSPEEAVAEQLDDPVPTVSVQKEDLGAGIVAAEPVVETQQGGDEPAEGPVEQSPKEDTITTPPATVATQTEDLDAEAAETEPTVSFPDESEDTRIEEEKEEKEGFLKRLKREKKEEALTEKRRKALQKKQEEIVEKESIRNAWKDYTEKKESLRQSGLDARDVRSYDTAPAENTTVRKQNVTAIVFVIAILIFMTFIVVSVSFGGEDQEPIAVASEEKRLSSDVILSDDVAFVDILSSPEEWDDITRSRSRNDTVTKYVPYVAQGSGRTQVGLTQFFQLFDITIPSGLHSAFDRYYFVGNYTNGNKAYGIFIVSVRNYNDATLWMLNWEKHAINAFSNVFPGILSPSNPENVTFTPAVISNKDVRILKNQNSENTLLYYFFNRSVLVFIAGDQDAVKQINGHIRTANR